MHGLQEEHITVNFALRPCALPHTQDYSFSSSMFSRSRVLGLDPEPLAYHDLLMGFLSLKQPYRAEHGLAVLHFAIEGGIGKPVICFP